MQTFIHELNDLTCHESILLAGTKLNFEAMQNSKLIIDFNHKTHVEPFSMLLAAHVFKKWASSCKQYNIDLRIQNHLNCSYASHMGFFKFFGVDYGKSPNEARGSRSYLPITIINVDELRQLSGSRRELIQDTIVRKSDHLASILGQGNYNLELVLSYAIREIMRNVVEHSKSNRIYLAAQRWENIGNVEIAIFDEGIGIANSLKENPNIQINDSVDALKHALKPGISGKAYYLNGVLQNSRNSDWDNSGFGLYVTSELCKMGGEFTIISNDAAITYDCFGQESFDTNITGTGIRLKLNIPQIPELGSEVINKIVTKGEHLAKQSGQNNISASKMTKIIK